MNINLRDTDAPLPTVDSLSRHNKTLAAASLSMGTAASDSDRFFEFVFNNPLIGMAIVGLDGRYLRVNMFLCELVGYSESELLAIDFQTITHPEDVERDAEWLQEGLDCGFQREKRYIHKDGQIVYAMLTASLFRQSDGTPRFFISQFLDITAQKKAEEALRLRDNAMNATTCGITIADARLPDAALVYVNPAFLEMTGFSLEETVGRNCRFLQAADTDQPALAKIREAVSTGTTITETLRNYRKDGTPFANELQISPIRGSDGSVTHFVGVANDITERLETAQRLRDSEARLREAQATASIGSWEYHIATGHVGWSDEMFRLLEFDPELGAPTFEQILDKYHPDDASRHFATVDQAAQNGEAYKQDLRAFMRDGSLRWLEACGRGEKDADGKVVRLVGTMLDITERKATEVKLQSLADALQRSNESLQEFAFIASHDLKEPLRKIRSFGELLQRKAGAKLPADCVDYLSRMIKASTRLQTLIDGLLDYAQLSHSKPKRTCVDTNEIMREVLADLEPTITEMRARIDVGTLPALAGDPMLIRQLMQNLIANALKFHKPDEPPVVRVYCESPGAQARSRIVVADDGIGFDPKYARTIFGIFERLHSVTEGTGIGLAVCQRIVDSCGGEISAESSPGRGAKFLVDMETCVLH